MGILDRLRTRRQGPPPDVPGESGAAPAAPGAQRPQPPRRMTKERVSRAEALLEEYRRGKSALDARIVDNEQWFKLRHWEQIRGRSRNPGDPEPASAWLFNCIANKHADAMDNSPQPAVLPREEGDKSDAKLLSSVLPAVLEQCGFDDTYSDVWWYKLKTGTGVYGVFWDARKNNGLGDIDIRKIDLLNMFWEPGISDIQQSRNLFVLELKDNDLLEEQYPQLKSRLSSPTLDVARYHYDDTIDTSKKSIVVDWYYKTDREGRTVLQYCKFCAGEVLYASEDDPAYAARGYYDHGKYPFVFDTMFAVEGTPAGFGYIDVGKDAQLYVDKLDQVIVKHAVAGSRLRFFVRGDGAVNEQEYADTTKEFVHFTGAGNPNESLFPIEVPNLSSAYIQIRDSKVEELKETTGNRDFSQGGTTSGITAASAIAALQEAGSKLSRDMIKSSYRAFSQICYMCIDLMRQFYTEQRYFRIVGERGAMEFVQFSGRQIAAKPQQDALGRDMGVRLPIFDVKVTSQKASPFSTVAQNERAKELYGMGFFRPDMADQALAALDMMDFEGIDEVRQRISQNQTLAQQVQMLQDRCMQLATIVDATQGTSIGQGMLTEITGQQQGGVPSGGGGAEVRTDALGNAFSAAGNSLAGQARQKAAETAAPR